MFMGLGNENSVGKLSGLLKSKFGVDLRVTSMLQGLESEAGFSKSEVRGGSLYVTICAEGQYLGTAIMAGAERLSAHDVSLASEMAKMVLEPTLLSQYLRLKENNSKVESSKDDHTSFSNVVDLFSNDSSDEVFAGTEFNSSLFLLQSTSPQTIQKAAVHIHEIGRRWAMMNYRDVRAQVKSLKDLKEIGAMTIIVDEVTSLSTAEQSLFVGFLQFVQELGESSAMPLILMGSSSSLQELVDSGKILPSLTKVLTTHRLELDRLPRDFKKLQESLQLFLDRKAQLT